MTNGTNPMGRARAARLIFSVCALGEMSFGVLCLVFPQLLAVVMNASLDSMGLLVTRMLGVAILGLGVTWWSGRNEPSRYLVSRYFAGFLIWNIGMAALFLARAIVAPEPALPWLVVVAHALAAVVFASAVL